MEVSEEEKQRMAEKAMEEERRREAVREKEPKFKLYCILDRVINKDFSTEEYINRIVKISFDYEVVGDEEDRWNQLIESFELKEQFDVFEEYDGLNAEDAEGVMLVVSLPLLTRGHAVQCHVLNDEHIQVRVPNIYNLLLGLPIMVDQDSIQSFFDCKVRRLFIHANKYKEPE